VDVPIEAKRPKTLDRLDDRLRKAVSQIETRRCPGVVALSLDRALREGRGVLHASSIAVAEAAVAGLVHKAVLDRIRQFAARVAGRPVRGIILFARLPCWLDDLDRPQLVSAAHVEVIARDAQTDLILDCLIDAFSRGQAV
jgi:hypothetical protein